MTDGIVSHMTWTTHYNYFIILFSGFCYQRMMLTNIDRGVSTPKEIHLSHETPLLAKALSIAANIPSTSEDHDKQISKNWFTTMSNNLTVTGIHFFDFLVITDISTDTIAVLLHLIYQVFLQFRFYSSVQNASSLSFTTVIILSYLWIVEYLFE